MQHRDAKRLRTEASDADIGLGPSLLSIVEPSLLNAPIAGTMKNFYSDFIVRELHYVSGAVSTLLGTKVPAEFASFRTKPSSDELPPTTLSVERVRSTFSEMGLQSIDVEQLCASCQTLIDGGAFEPVLLGAITDKAARSAVHSAVRTVMGPRFESSTKDGGAVLVQIAAAQQRGARQAGAVGSQRQATGWHSTWPKGKPEFLHFTLYKENIDTMGALRMLAQKMCISQRRLSFAGTKDKRAITVQRVSCKHLEAEKVAGLNGSAWGRNGFAMVGDFTYETYGLTLGRSQGNRFTIVIRDVSNDAPSSVDINALSAFISAHGFVNYFGPQRFGTTSILTSDVGRCVLNKDYRGAVALIFKSKAEVCPDFAPALDAYEGVPPPHNAAAALNLCPHFCGDERDMLQLLAAEPNNIEGAVLTLPRNMLMLYCHAVQSLVWNTVVAKRIAECNKVVEGDLVLSSTIGKASTVAAASGDGGDGEGDAEPNAAEGDVAAAEAAVHRVTKEEALAGTFQMHDIVLPVPGPDPAVQYPLHESCNRDTYLDIAAGLDASALVRDEHGLAKLFHFHGTYRRAVVRPKDLSLRFVSYSHPKQMLVLSDAMRLRGEALTEESRVGGAGEGDAPSMTPAPSTALIAEFSLPAGSYATSLLREFVNCRPVNDA